MSTESSENESINSDPNYVIKKNSSAESVAFLEKLRLENPNRLIFGHLNINSIRNKFEMLTNIIQGKLDILLVSLANLTDLSKAFDCIPHELIIAKLDANGFNLKGLIHVFNYLRNGKQRVKINSSYSGWSDLLFGVPQGSILGPLLFIIFICDLFYFEENVDIASYADDNTPYCASHDIQTTINTLQDSSVKLFDWFPKNSMTANANKCHLLLSKNIKHVACINHIQIENNTSEKLLGVTIDSELKFDIHVNNLCKKATQKLNALARISGYMDSSKKRTRVKAFINSHFSYLVWMFHSREINNKINRVHKRSLRLVYSDKTSTFKELLDKGKSVSGLHRNIQLLATEIYKAVNGLAPTIMNSIFEINNIEDHLSNKNNLKSRRINFV